VHFETDLSIISSQGVLHSLIMIHSHNAS